MSLKVFTFQKSNKKFKISCKKCNFFGLARGLMFRTKQTSPLLFEVKRPMAIHSLFVFFPFFAVWLDKNNKVVEIKKVKPFTTHVFPKKHFTKLLEIPINNSNKKIISQLKS